MSESNLKLPHVIAVAQAKQELANQLTHRLLGVMVKAGVVPERTDGYTFEQIIHACDAYLGIEDPGQKEVLPC